MDEPFRHRFRVRYAELDPQSVVFNSRYLEYADILVTEFFRDRAACGMPDGLEFHVRRAEVDFLKPIRADELIEGRLTVEKLGTTSTTMRVELHGTGAGESDLRAAILLVSVNVDLSSGTPQPLPAALRTCFGFPAEEAADA